MCKISVRCFSGLVYLARSRHTKIIPGTLPFFLLDRSLPQALREISSTFELLACQDMMGVIGYQYQGMNRTTCSPRILSQTIKPK
jgi:hypothetical protein